MKLFRRISALALAVVIICLLSASAFAANHDYNITYNFYDAESSSVTTFADFEPYWTSGTLEINPTAMISSNIEVELEYRYYDATEGRIKDGDRPIENFALDVTTLSASKNYSASENKTFVDAYYTFNASFTNLSGQFQEYSNGPVLVTNQN